MLDNILSLFFNRVFLNIYSIYYCLFLHIYDLVEAVLTTWRGTEWMLKLRTVYLNVLIKKVSNSEDQRNEYRFKIDNGNVEKLFSDLSALF